MSGERKAAVSVPLSWARWNAKQRSRGLRAVARPSPGDDSLVDCIELRPLTPHEKERALSSAAPVDRDRPIGPRSRKGAEARARLLDAAKTVFEKDGFLEARITDIALCAGLSHGSYYHYFDSKEQIFREVAEALEDRLSSPLSNVIFDSSSTAAPRQRIREGIRRYLESYQKEARIIGVVEQVSRYDDGVNAIRFKHQRHTCDQIAESIRDLQRRGLADPGLDPTITAPALGAMTSRFAEMWLVQNFLDYSLDEGAEQLTTLFVNALQLRDAPARPAAT